MTASTAAALSAVSLSFHAPGRTLVHDMSLQVQTGEIVGLLGPNGAGKSTTLRMLAGDLAPASGEIHLAGHSLREQPIPAKQALGYLPDVPPLYADMRVAEFLLYAAQLRRLSRAQAREAVQRVLGECQLNDVARQRIDTLSKGYLQRVGLAQATVHQPKVLLLDEPTVGLDPNQQRDFRQLLTRLKSRCAILVSTHILRDVEALCGRVLVMAGGTTRYQGKLGDMPGAGALDERFHRLTEQTTAGAEASS